MKIKFVLILNVLRFCFSKSELLGTDVSSKVTIDQWNCLSHDYVHPNRYYFGVVRILRQNGRLDRNAAVTIQNAYRNQVSVLGYAWPCQDYFKKTICPSGTKQIQSVISYLNKNDIAVCSLFLDIERGDWSKNITKNVKFIQELVDALIANNVEPLFYTSKRNWLEITGNSTLFSQYKLWYSHYDNKPDFNDFETFGGWTTPAMKQYRKDVALCGTNVDLNYVANSVRRNYDQCKSNHTYWLNTVI